MAMGPSLESLTQWGSLEPAFYLTFLGILMTWQVWGTLNLSTGDQFLCLPHSSAHLPSE